MVEVLNAVVAHVAVRGLRRPVDLARPAVTVSVYMRNAFALLLQLGLTPVGCFFFLDLKWIVFLQSEVLLKLLRRRKTLPLLKLVLHCFRVLNCSAFFGS